MTSWSAAVRHATSCICSVPRGGPATGVFAELPYPIFNLAFDANDRLWATTGGGPLLELDPTDGSIIAEHGDGLTMGLAIDPTTGDIVVGSRYGVERFNPTTETFKRLSRDLNIRVGSLAFADDGTLWGVQWPQRNAVLRFTPLGRAETMMTFDTPIDSIAFGQKDTSLKGLMFVTHNTGASGFGASVAPAENSQLTMVDVATLRRVTLARGGSRGDVVTTTSDGRILVSQSGQVDVLTPNAIPQIVATNPAEKTFVALPLGLISVTYSVDMFVGKGIELNSVTHPGNYALRAAAGDHPVVKQVRYDQATRTAYLFVEGIQPGDVTLYVGKGITSSGGFAMAAGYEVHFTAVSEFSANVDINLSGTRLDRQNQAISYEVTIRNKGSYDLLLPLTLLLDPANHVKGVPGQVATPAGDGRWLFSLNENVPGGVRLRPGEVTTAKTIRLLAPNFDTADFLPGVLATAAPNVRPRFDSNAVTTATAGQNYVYDANATDPDGVAIAYLLHRGPQGMTVDPTTGIITWSTPSIVAARNDVTLYAFDSRGGFTAQTFTINVVGGNRAPTFTNAPSIAEITENQTLRVDVRVFDSEGNAIRIWADNLPNGAYFDSRNNSINWSPGADAAGVYRDVTLYATDGVNTISHSFDIVVSQADRAPNVVQPPKITLREGNQWTYRLEASDPDGDELRYLSNGLPKGATLDARTGVLRWDVGFDQFGTRLIPITVSAGQKSTTINIEVEVLRANGAPLFDSMQGWSVEEGQTLVINSFARDPDHPDFVLPTRNSDGSLNPIGAVSPVTYRVTGLPDGATFDAQTATFKWTPRFNQAGTYNVTFTATDDGDTVGSPITITSIVPITVRDINQRPIITAIPNVAVQRGEVREFEVTATDPDGNAITLSAASGLPGFPLPSFVTFEDKGQGKGLFRVAAGAGDRGNYTLSLFATDDGNGHGRGVEETLQYDFVVSVLSPNDPPVLRAIPASMVVVAGQAMQLPLLTRDIDQEPLQYSVTGLPPSAIITAGVRYGEATLDWTTTAADIGTYTVTVSVEDNGNGNASAKLISSQSFTVIVRGTNASPSVGAIGTATVAEGAPLQIQFNATDADSDLITWSSSNLPQGAMLDAVTGQLRWTPNFDQAGTYLINVAASDGAATTTGNLSVTVTPTNRTPQLAFPAEQFGREDAMLEFRVVGADADGGLLTLTAVNVPVGASFDPTSGRFRWRPSFAQAGSYAVGFRLTDSAGAFDSVTVPIVIDNVNRSPVIASQNHQVVIGGSLQFSIAASDPDTDNVLRYSAYGLPAGATLNPTTGKVTWIPNPGQLGQYVVDVRASDSLAETRQVIIIDSVASPQLPNVRIVLTPSFPTLPGQNVRVQVIADGYSPITAISLTLDGAPVTLDSLGRATIAATTPGKLRLVATATDSDGFVGTSNEVLRVRDASDRDAPVVSLSMDGDSQIVSGPTSLFANVIDSNLDSWTIRIAKKARMNSEPRDRGQYGIKICGCNDRSHCAC